MAQDTIFLQGRLQYLFEYFDVIDPLADERPFAEKVLVNVGRGQRIGVNAGRFTLHTQVQGRRRRRGCGSYPIHFFSLAFQVLGRWKRKKMSSPACLYLSFSASILLLAR